MKHIDEVRGYERDILFSPSGGHATGGSVPLTNCVVDILEDDFEGHCPMLALRFYHKPFYGGKVAQELADAGNPVFDENTPIGVELRLGPEMAQSLLEQLQNHWSRYANAVQEYPADSDGPSES